MKLILFDNNVKNTGIVFGKDIFRNYRAENIFEIKKKFSDTVVFWVSCSVEDIWHQISTPEMLFDVIYSDRSYCRFNLLSLRVGSMQCERSFNVAPKYVKRALLFLTCLLKLELMSQLQLAMISLKSIVIDAIDINEQSFSGHNIFL